MEVEFDYNYYFLEFIKGTIDIESILFLCNYVFINYLRLFTYVKCKHPFKPS